MHHYTTHTPHRPGARRLALTARHVGRTRGPAALTWADLGVAPGELDWQTRGRCRDTDPDAFFPDDTGRIPNLDTVRSLCHACPVQTECRSYALARPELVGVWGGLTDTERGQPSPSRRRTPRRPRTDTDADIARRTRAGQTEGEIAAVLDLSTRTVQRARARQRMQEAA